VKISRSGGGWVCAEKAKANSRSWKERNPQRSRTSSNPHILSWKSVEDGRGLCSIDGPVTIVPWGRGWICETKARYLGRVSHQNVPLKWCRDCWAEMEGDVDRYRVWLRADGTCPRCSEPMDLNMEFKKMAADERLRDAAAGLVDIAGVQIVGLRDPYAMDEYESAVPGWKTIGTR
jgi:hypothetical protein